MGVYLGFFPHLVAGPIIRAHLFLPQLERERVFDAGLFWEGCRKFAIGFLYKAVFADNIAAAINPIWGSLESRSGMEILGACVGFYGQIYFDLAGYSLMAIGAANWLGYTIPENFRFPYLAASVVDFWRRWHISLSTWLRDFVYIPLGGNRLGEGRRYVNLTATMLLGGLWHGPSWNFVIWGGLAWGGFGVEPFVDGMAGAGGFFAEESGVGEVGWGSSGLACGAGFCDVVLGAVSGGVVCGYADCVGGLKEHGLRGGRGGKEFPLDACACAAGGGYFFGFAEGGKWHLGGAEAGDGGGFVGCGGAGGDFVHEGGIGAVFVFPVLRWTLWF